MKARKNRNLSDERIIELLDAKGYTDKVDVSTEISFFEYGIIRNPKTGHVIYSMEDEDGNRYYDYTFVDMDEVEEDLKEIDDGFFDFIGSDLNTVLTGLDNNYLTDIIRSMNDYNGMYQQSCTFREKISDLLK